MPVTVTGSKQRPESVLGCMSRPALSRAVEKPLRDGIFLLQLRERSHVALCAVHAQACWLGVWPEREHR